MSPEIERLIRLQGIESRAADASRKLADAPGRIASLDAKLTASRNAVTAARHALSDNQDKKRSIEKDIISAQQRLSKYKEQLMAVKTNDEYHAMQHQIVSAGKEVERAEEAMLVNMMAADEQNAALKAAEAKLKADEAAIAAERTAIEAEVGEMKIVVQQCAAERAEVTAQMDRAHVELFDRIAKLRHGVALARAVDQRCTVCQVGIRPQVFQELRQSNTVHQCHNCNRILYYIPLPPPHPL